MNSWRSSNAALRGSLKKGGSGFQPVLESGHPACCGEFSHNYQAENPNSITARMAVFQFESRP